MNTFAMVTICLFAGSWALAGVSLTSSDLNALDNAIQEQSDSGELYEIDISSWKEVARLRVPTNDAEANALEAVCGTIAADASVCPEVKRYASLRELFLLSQSYYVERFMAKGRLWIQLNPRDALNPEVRCQLSMQLGGNTLEILKIPWQERLTLLQSLMDPVFANDQIDWNTYVQGRLLYANAIKAIGQQLTLETLRLRFSDQKLRQSNPDKYQATMTALQIRYVTLQREQVSRALNYFNNVVIPDLARGEQGQVDLAEVARSQASVKRELESIDATLAALRARSSSNAEGTTPAAPSEGLGERALDEHPE